MIWYDWTYIILIPGLLLGLWAQYNVKNTISKYSQVSSGLGMPASQAVDQLLRDNGNCTVKVESTSGSLTDHYNPKTGVLALSQDVYGSSSLAALGIAAHEAGHAMQQQDEYGPLKIRTAVVPAVNIGSQLYFPLFVAGLIFSWQPLVFAGIILFGLTVLFSLITLPVELDASRRAVAMLKKDNMVSAGQIDGVQKVLRAAALTYVASALMAILQLVRLLAISQRNNRRR